MTHGYNPIKTMSRKASDNKYLHKDFHLSMNLLMEYIYKNFGKDKLIDYLKQYTIAYHKPMYEQIQSGNIEALSSYFRDLYEKEEWPIKITQEEDRIVIEQHACPGISHIKSKGGKPIPLYVETYKTVYTTLCENTPFEYELVFFDDETGACLQLFKRKEKIK